MLEDKIIPSLIASGIIGIITGYFAGRETRIRLEGDVRTQGDKIKDLGKKIDNLIELPRNDKLEETINDLIKLPRNEELEQKINYLIELLSSNITNDEKKSYLQSLKVEITEPRDGETITKEDSYPIRGIIKNIPEGMRLNNLSKELGLYVLHTSDYQKFWLQMSDIRRDISSNEQNSIEFHSSHLVNHSRDVLIVSAGEKSKGCIEFYQECYNKQIFYKANDFPTLPGEIIGSDIRILAKVHINFHPS